MANPIAFIRDASSPTISFSGTGSQKNFTFTAKPPYITVRLNGQVVTNYTYNSSTGVISFVTAPPVGINNITVNCDETVHAPTSYEYGLQDVSSNGAGRTQDYTMNKMRQGQTRTLALKWQGLSFTEAADVLRKFNPEYVILTYFDAVTSQYISEEMYIGNRNMPMYNATLGVWKEVSFNVISRKISNYSRTTNTWSGIPTSLYAW